MEITEAISITSYENGQLKEKEEIIASDETIKLIINETLTRSFSISPSHLADFAKGYMLGEGLITETDNIEKLEINGNEITARINLEDFDIRKELMVGSDCFGGWRSKIDYIDKVESDYEVKAAELLKNIELLRENADTWQKTGGTHVAAFVNNESKEFIVREDVSRHVAVDKVIGAAAEKKLDFKNSYIIYSGRMPADMLIKIARVGIPIIGSNAAPTISGYTVANEANITMVGFLRDNRFNIYTHKNRIIIE
ncbi:formate dehydrogenase accessory sulfurtransferase FdhD [Methanobrevibacter filiformis]|uniref:Sulfur carrier protein FdhD n=1 Tax=Methanobrevibacter filiformis TaxID=55758 RepID=A0A165ZFF6_9EURY|nr:formate dehydrogenase accessory sulfurtransferase FdhD [Methanobrevibacter filiformis]KZX10642.1 protein FdhD [Methanobrevibacter filiformis]